MKLLQIYLLLIVPFLISIDISKISAYENENFDYPEARFKKCKPLIPGLDKMQSGIDITEWDFFAAKPHTRNGVRRQIFDFTCNGNLTWTNEIIGQEYVFPDQLEHPIANPISSSGNFKKLTRGSREYKDSLIVGMALSGIDSDTTKGAISLGSTTIDLAQEKLFTDLAYMHQIVHTTATYSFTRNSRMPALTEDFIASVKQLPEKYVDDPGKYDTFINDYGTHFFVQATMGGRCYQTLNINYTYVNSKTDLEIQASAEALFNNYLKPSSGISSNQDVKELIANSEKSQDLTGGNQSYARMFTQSNSGSFLGDWILSLNRFPWIIGGQVKPIESLVKDPKRKIQLRLAINVHYLRTKVKLAETKLNSLQKSMTSHKLTIEEYGLGLSFITKKQQFLSCKLCVANQTAVAKAMKQVDFYFKVMDYYEAANFIAKQYEDAIKEYNANYLSVKSVIRKGITCSTVWGLLFCESVSSEKKNY